MSSQPASSPVEAARLVKEAARREGFDLVGIARAEPLDAAPLDKWFDHGWDASLGWVKNSRDLRLDVRNVLPGAQSVVAVAVSYRHPDPLRPDEPAGTVARYARGRDYHNVMRRPLKRLREFIETISPGADNYTSCDARPVMEKAWAQRAGLGWIGKNGCLIAPPFGSYVLLGTVITTAELAADAPHPERCGTCVACLSSCPTDAIPEPRYVDAGKCISFHTIEHRDPIPPSIAANLGGRIFGCDACQEVCPWNRHETPPAGKLSEGMRPHEGQGFVPLESLLRSSDEELTARIHGTPLARAGVEGLRRTARAILDEQKKDQK
jgi:epoxyqueuosine reductase